MRFLFGLAYLVVTASGFAPVVHRSLSIARVGSEKTTTALFSAVPKQRGGGDGFREVQVSKDGLERPEVPAFVNGVVVGALAFGVAMCSLFFHMNPFVLIGMGVLMAGGAAVTGASDRHNHDSLSSSSSSSVQAIDFDTVTTTAYDEPEPLLVNKFEYETLEEASPSVFPDEPVIDTPEFPTSASFSTQEFTEEYAPEPHVPPMEESSPLQVVDPGTSADAVEETSIYTDDLYTPLVPATALYSSSTTTQLDSDPVPLRTKIDRLKTELELAREFFDELEQ